MSTLWTPAEIATAQAMRAKGEVNRAIAAKLGRTLVSVRKKLLALDAPPPRRAVIWTEAQDDAIRKMRAKGITYSAIADRMGRSIKAVEARALRIGVPAFVKPASTSRPARVVRPRDRFLLAESMLSPFGYDEPTRAWALSNPGIPEAKLILVHLVERGDVKRADALAVLAAKSHASKGASA